MASITKKRGLGPRDPARPSPLLNQLTGVAIPNVFVGNNETVQFKGLAGEVDLQQGILYYDFEKGDLVKKPNLQRLVKTLYRASACNVGMDFFPKEAPGVLSVRPQLTAEALLEKAVRVLIPVPQLRDPVLIAANEPIASFTYYVGYQFSGAQRYAKLSFNKFLSPWPKELQDWIGELQAAVHRAIRL